MEAAFLTQNRMIEIRQIPAPVVDEGGVLVEMRVAAVCRTDLKMVMEGHRDLILPRIPGHEGVGEVIESRSPKFKAGDWVAVYPGIFCGKCPACRTGHTARCETIRIFGFNEDGFFRTRMFFGKEAAPSLVRLRGSGFPDTIALTEPLSCCLSAAGKGSSRKGSALIVGAGAVGSIFAGLLISENWDRVIVADRVKRRLRTEMPAGVETVHAPTGELLAALKTRGWNHGIDFMVPCCPQGLDWPFWEVMRPGGTVAFFSGGVGGNTMLCLDMNAVHYLELSLTGSYGCNYGDFVSAADMLSEGRIDLSFFDLYAIPLKGLSQGMEKLENQEVKKVIIYEF